MAIVYAVLAGILFLHHFVILLYYPVWAAGAQKLTVVWAVFALVSVVLGRLWRRKECWIAAAFLALMGLRVMVAEKALPVDAVLVLSSALYAFFICYGVPFVLPPELRKKALTVFTAVWTLASAVLSVIGVVLCWTGSRMTNLVGEFFGLTSYGRLGLFSNPNITGGFFACGVFAALVLFTLVQSRLIRGLCIPAVLFMTMATSLSGTRCASIAISVAVCILICLCLQKPLKKIRFRYGILALIFIACFGVLTLAQIRFNGYFVQFRNNSRAAVITTAQAESDLSESEASKTQTQAGTESETRETTAETVTGIKAPGSTAQAGSGTEIPAKSAQLGIEAGTEASAQTGTETATPSEEEDDGPTTYIQQRGGLSFSSLDDLTSGRIGIWADGFRVFTQSPMQMIFGDSVLNPGLKALRMNHYHNLFLQVLFESGILGFLLFAAFLLFFLIRAFRLIRQEDRPLWQRFLPAPALAILTMELLDCLTLFANGHVPMTMLYLFMGATVAVSEAGKNPLFSMAPASRAALLGKATVVILSLWIGAAAFIVNRRNSMLLAVVSALVCFAVPCFLALLYLAGKPLLPRKQSAGASRHSEEPSAGTSLPSGKPSAGETLLQRNNLKFLWGIAGLFALLWVLLSLNNSSVGIWREILMNEGHATLFGTARVVRGDEWAVWTPFLFSQASQGFPSVNTAIAASATDPTLIAIGGLPAWNLAVVFKPFYWGFLLLGTERGYSLLTLLRVVCLAAVSYAAAKRYTRGSRPLSVAAAFLITLSPYVQWWFSQSICEVLIFSQGAVLAWIKALKAGTPAKRLGFGALGAWCLGCFALVLYPAWLIPVLYLVIAVMILYVVRHRREIRPSAAAFTFAPLAVTAILLFFIVRNSWPTLQRIQASVYPGQQTYSGGDRPLNLLTGLYSLTFSMVGPKVSTASDLSCFVSFFPLGIILTGLRFFKEKKRDAFSVILLCFMGVFTLLALVKLPAWLTKITLLSLCTRPVMIISLCDLLLLLRALSFRFSRDSEAGAVDRNENWQPYSARRLAVAALCLIIVAGGAFVNPVQQGFATVETLPTVRAAEAANLPADTVIAVEADWPTPDSLLFTGRKILNSTHPYADPEKWRAVDPGGTYEDIYNRLCHVSLSVADGAGSDHAGADENAGSTETADNNRQTDSQPKFELLEGDHIRANLTPEDLKTLGAQVLLTEQTHSDLTLLSATGSWKVYQLDD